MNGPRLRRRVGVVAGDRQITDEEALVGRQVVDPAEDASHRRGFVDAETRFVVAADGAGVFQCVVAAIADDCIHAQIHEPAGMKQPGAVALFAQHRRQCRPEVAAVRFRGRIQCGVKRTLHGEKALDGLGVNRVGMLEQDRPFGQTGEVGHGVFDTRHTGGGSAHPSIPGE